MKNNLLIALAFASAAPALAQSQANGKPIKPALFSHFTKKENSVAKPVLNQTLPNSPLSSNVAAFTWTNIANSINIYGVVIDGQKPLQYNPYVDAVSFIHRKGPDYIAAPDNNSGAIIARISTNWGATWDSTCFYSDGVNLARYPQGGIYSAPGNTNIANAYVVGTGIVTDGANWIGSWFASKQLGAGNYNSGASTAPNAMQVMPNYAPYGTAGKDDYSTYAFQSTNDGKVRAMGFFADDINGNPGDLRGYKINTGSFNAGVFVWTGDSILPPCYRRNDSTKLIGYTPVMAWSENGTIGYAVALGARIGSTGPNRGIQPIIYKTSNSGASWALLSGIDFSLPTYSTVLNRLAPVDNGTITIPQFTEYESLDATVDANGKLHLGVTIKSTYRTELDSLEYNASFTSEDYSWPHTAGQHPYLYDFYGDGTGPWQYITVDSITSECPSDQSGYPGYGDNPWDDDGGKVRSGSRIQLSRTPDGKHVIYTWAESNPAFTNLQKFWNTLPDVKARLVDFSGSTPLLSPTKINLTPVGTAVNNKAMFHFASRLSSANTSTSTSMVSVKLPVTVTNSNPYTQGSTNSHWYCSAQLDFSFPGGTDIGFNENILEASNTVIFPNPAKENAALSIELKDNSKVEVIITDVVGRCVKTVSQNCTTGSNTIDLDLGQLSSGVYMVNVHTGNATATKKLIVE
jgi:hypothetical protein